MDDLAPEHLEINTADDDFYFGALRNYGSIFIGPWSTVAYSDKGMAGTNHVLPTAGGARHSAGLSVCAVPQAARPTSASNGRRRRCWPRRSRPSPDYEGMEAHRATATLRLERYAST